MPSILGSFLLDKQKKSVRLSAETDGFSPTVSE